jgi:hypothetical protein
MHCLRNIRLATHSKWMTSLVLFALGTCIAATITRVIMDSADPHLQPQG